MKKFLITFLLLIIPIIPMMAQVNDEGAENADAISVKMVEQKPTFKGESVNEFCKWVNSQLMMPEKVLSKTRGPKSWKVILSFAIDVDGSLTDVKVQQSSGEPAIDAEAVRVVTKSPKWEPGRQEDQPVKVSYTFPIMLQIR